MKYQVIKLKKSRKKQEATGMDGIPKSIKIRHKVKFGLPSMKRLKNDWWDFWF